MDPCPLTCPVCAAPLERSGATYRCSAGHSFDRSRQGWVDLLPHGHGRSGRTGDSREMIAARGRFLDRGHYEPLQRAVAAAAVRQLRTRGGAAVLLDAGCGDGYYAAGVVEAAARDGLTPCCCAFDISPWALRSAARRCGGCTYFLNDVTHRICVADGSIDCLLNVFAPRNATEFARVLRPGGLLLVVIPAATHLAELAPLLRIGSAPGKLAATTSLFSDGFDLDDCLDIGFRLDLDGDDVSDLLRMTPNAWHLEEEPARHQENEPVRHLEESDSGTGDAGRDVTAAFHLLSLRKRHVV